MSKKLFRHVYLMCRPQYFSVSYRINPWMEPSKIPSNWETAAKQWQHLHHLLIRLGGYVDYIEPKPGLPDMVFTANHGLLGKCGKKFVIPRFAHVERQGEEKHIKEWARENKLVCFKPVSNFEGAGDALWFGDMLFCGYDTRSQFTAYKEIEEFLGTDQTVYCRLVDDYFYHLDTCFCPLHDDQAIFYPGEFDEPSIKRMEDACALHAIPEEEARLFACNSVVVNGYNIIVPEGCPKTEEILRSLDFEVYPTPMTEYIKAGGAAKCCTLQLWGANGTTDN